MGVAEGAATGAAMGSIVPGVGTAAGAIGGALVGGLLGYAGQQSANQTNVDIARQATQSNIATAREQMAFQERMSNTAHQREVADLRAAGINPLLSGKLGGSSTPSGAAGQAATTTVENSLSPLGKGVQAAVSNYMDLVTLQGNLAKQGSDIAANAAYARQADAQARVAGVEALNAAKRGQLLDADAAEAILKKEFYSSKSGKATYYMDKYGNVLDHVGGVLGNVFRFLGRGGTNAKPPPAAGPPVFNDDKYLDRMKRKP